MDKRERILVVEDDPAWVGTLHDVLEREGYSVEIAINHGEALEALQREPERFSLAIVDLRLSRVNEEDRSGVALLEAIATFNRAVTEQIPMIVITAYGTPELVRKAFEDCQVAAFLRKEAYDAQEFRRTVREAIKTRETRQTKKEELTPEQKRKYEDLTRRLFGGEIISPE